MPLPMVLGEIVTVSVSPAVGSPILTPAKGVIPTVSVVACPACTPVIVGFRPGPMIWVPVAVCVRVAITGETVFARGIRYCLRTRSGAYRARA